MENKEEEITWSITLDKEAVFTEDEIGVLLHTATVSSSEAEKLIKMPDVEIVEILKKRDSNVRNLIMLCEMAEQVAAEAKEKGFPGKEYETVAEMRGMTDLAVNEAVLLARLKGTRLKASFASIITKLHLYKNAKLQFDETQKQG